jgi:hypothetical protein
MTIALGILASDGLVIAADTQETHAGLVKVPQGKIAGAVLGKMEKPDGVLAVSGAGSGGHIDSLTQQFIDGFHLEKPAKLGDLDGELSRRLLTFHSEHIVPYLQLPEYERPSVSMLIGARLKGKFRLWVSDKSTLHQCVSYGAVGLGAGHANVLLERLWDEGGDVRFAARVALFVLFYVKRYTEGCGHDSQLLIVGPEQANSYDPNAISGLEREFGRYLRIEAETLRYVLGGTSDDEQKDRAKLESSIEMFRRKIMSMTRRPPIGDFVMRNSRGIPSWTPEVDEIPPSRAKRGRSAKQ